MNSDSAVEYFPRVAVLLAAYNGMAYIEQQLQSILGQVGVRVTVFISVDSSNDGTEAWTEQFAAHDSRIKILPHGEKFGGAARNFYRLIRDVDLSSFDHVSFADQDDVWFPDKLSRACERLKEECCDAYSSNVIAFWPDGKKMLVDKAQSQREWDYLLEAAGPGCTYVMTRKLACSIQNFVINNRQTVDQVSLHDWFCYAYSRASGYKWFIDSQPGMFYRQHAQNQFGVNNGFKASVHRLKKVSEGWWLGQALLIAKLVDKGNSEFVKQWSGLDRLGFFKLAFSAPKCRRKRRDQLFFFFLCLLLAVFGFRK